MELWHGSRRVVRRPRLALCRPHNDYGAGFYCTPDRELAKEWACTPGSGGFANRYELDTAGLSMLDLESDEYTALDWLAVLVANRVFQPPTALAAEAIDYLKRHFLPDLAKYDLVSGYRADDSYFSFARAFVTNQISLRQLSEAMRLGGLGTQVMLRSERAFGAISYRGFEPAPEEEFYARRALRDSEARASYRSLCSSYDQEGLYMADILREGVGADDARLRI